MDRVAIIAGKHKGKMARFIKRTPERVAVQIEEGETLIYLIPKHVDMTVEDSIGESNPSRGPTEVPSVAPRRVDPVSSADHQNQWVSVVAGKHKGKTLRFIKRTPQKVCVQLEDGKVIYLNQSAVNMKDDSSAHSRTQQPYNPTAAQSASASSGDNSQPNRDNVRDNAPAMPPSTPPLTDTDEDDNSFSTAIEEDEDSYEFVSTADLTQDAGNPVQETSIDSSTAELLPGSRVFITSGTHSGQVATFVKRTAQKICVTLESDDSKMRYFDPKSVSTQPPGMASLYDDADPVSRAFHDALGVPVEFHNSTATKVHQTLFGALFGEDAVFFEVKTHNLVKLPQEVNVPHQKRKMYLTVNKIHDKAKSLTCAYVWANSNEEVACRLLELGAFDKLSHTKAAARLDLLLSTASSNPTGELTHHIHTSLSPSDFRIIPEHGNVGCGYIPRSMIDKLVGDGAIDVFGLQVRVAIPSMGIFKGVLTEKPGIDKIELPPSMQKVNGSVSSTTNQDTALLMINQNGIYPYQARMLRQENHFADGRDIPPMARWMLIQKGVSNSYLCKRNRHHDMCKGLIDPTGGLPSGCVFLTGIQDDLDMFGDKILISRYPMTEASDGLVVPIVKKKPQSMSSANWEFLCKLKFGAVYFGKPPPGERALPEYIAQGDCDGDDYFICWDSLIVADALIGDRPKLATKKSMSKPPTKTGRWWLDTQEFMMDVASRKSCHRLISSLHTMWLQGLRSNNQQEALVFGRASKEAIDAPKHGGRVDLPEELWKHIPLDLRCYLKKSAPSPSGKEKLPHLM